MTVGAPARPGPARRVLSRRAGLAIAIGLLAITTVVANAVLPRWSLGGWAYPLVNGAMAGLLVLLAARCGLDSEQIGFDRRTLRRSALVGLAGAALVGLAYALALAPLRQAFDDERAAGLSVGWLLWVAAVRIPIGTVLLEEVAFRGVLPALLGGSDRAHRRSWTPPRHEWWPALGASVLFGLWHVLPSLSLAGQNAALGSLFGSAATVLVPLLAVAGSTLAGLWLYWWRYAGRGLLTPIMVHVATNSGALVAAWAVSG